MRWSNVRVQPTMGYRSISEPFGTLESLNIGIGYVDLIAIAVLAFDMCVNITILPYTSVMSGNDSVQDTCLCIRIINGFSYGPKAG